MHGREHFWPPSPPGYLKMDRPEIATRPLCSGKRRPLHNRPRSKAPGRHMRMTAMAGRRCGLQGGDEDVVAFHASDCYLSGSFAPAIDLASIVSHGGENICPYRRLAKRLNLPASLCDKLTFAPAQSQSTTSAANFQLQGHHATVRSQIAPIPRKPATRPEPRPCRTAGQTCHGRCR